MELAHANRGGRDATADPNFVRRRRNFTSVRPILCPPMQVRFFYQNKIPNRDPPDAAIHSRLHAIIAVYCHSSLCTAFRSLALTVTKNALAQPNFPAIS
jgi:hypothetical protein